MYNMTVNATVAFQGGLFEFFDYYGSMLHIDTANISYVEIIGEGGVIFAQ